jgi:hypothetical protein
MIKRPNYRPYNQYATMELRALKFASVREFNRAIYAIFHNPNLRKLPYDTPDGMTLFVPQESVRYFEESRLKFKFSRLLNVEDVPREKLSRLRENGGMLSVC